MVLMVRGFSAKFAQRACTSLVEAMGSNYGIVLYLCSPTFISDLDQWEALFLAFIIALGAP